MLCVKKKKVTVAYGGYTGLLQENAVHSVDHVAKCVMAVLVNELCRNEIDCCGKDECLF